MRTSRAILILLVTCFILKSSPGAGAQAPESKCRVITAALRSVQTLTPGTARSQLEKDFELDGGMQFAAHSRYVFKACNDIKIDVELSGTGIDDRADFLPTDTIVKVSEPYLELPSTD